MARFTTQTETLPLSQTDLAEVERVAHDERPTFGRRHAVTPEPRTNGYPGKCTGCGQWVEATKGLLSGSAGAWTVTHRAGECHSPVDADVEPVTKPVVTAQPVTFAVPEGRYTVEFENGDYRTLKVSKQDDDADFMPGRFILAFLSGSNNDRDYTRFAHVDEATGNVKPWRKYADNLELREAVRVLVGDPRGASQAYAEASSSCSRCGRSLTVPASLHAGLGPECAKKVAW